jgi:hypothetical protein
MQYRITHAEMRRGEVVAALVLDVLHLSLQSILLYHIYSALSGERTSLCYQDRGIVVMI